MSQALIDLDLFDPGGCETPPLPFNPEQIEVIKKVVSGEAFEESDLRCSEWSVEWTE